MNAENTMENIVIPLGISIGSAYLLNKVGVPYVLGIPISGAAFVLVVVNEGLRKSNSNSPTLYEWYIEGNYK